jgi:hypothetical protein
LRKVESLKKGWLKKTSPGRYKLGVEVVDEGAAGDPGVELCEMVRLTEDELGLATVDGGTLRFVISKGWSCGGVGEVLKRLEMPETIMPGWRPRKGQSTET